MKKMPVLLLILVLGITVAITAYLSLNQTQNQARTAANLTVNEKATNPIRTVDIQPLRVMTYNIRHGRGMDGKVDLERIARVIRDSGAGVIGLNEVDRRKSRSGFQDQVKFLAEKLKMDYAFGPTIGKGFGSYGNALLSRYPLSGVRNHLLPEKTGMERRGLLEAKVTPDGRETITVMTTHLSLDGEEREQQLNWLDEYLRKQNTPFLLMGDFNSFDTGDFSFQPVVNGLKTFPSNHPTEEIDLLFSALNYQPTQSYTIGSEASDHLPVVVEFIPV